MYSVYSIPGLGKHTFSAYRDVYRQVTIDKALSDVAEFYNIHISHITGKCRQRNIAEARHLFRWICVRSIGIGTYQLAKVTDCNHASVIHSVRQIENYYEVDIQVRERINRFMRK
jgi:chromosomal replication initiation ATPase DnaA